MNQRMDADPTAIFADAPALPSKAVHTYRLKFFDDGLRPAKDVEFEAGDASAALAIAHKIARNRDAELWCDGRRFCRIEPVPGGVWRLTAASAFEEGARIA